MRDYIWDKIVCVVCGSVNTEELSKKSFRGIRVNVAICPDCGLVYLNPRWSRESYSDFNQNHYERYFRKKNLTGEVAEEAKFNNAKLMLQRIEKLIPDSVDSVLDIGANRGWDLLYLKSIFPKISLSAIEPSNFCIEKIKKQKNIKLIAKDINEDWHLKNKEKFSLITMCMTLEHLLSPLESLKKINQALSPDGLLYLTVPNMMKPKMKGSLNNYWYRAVHTYYFSEPTLLALVSKAGLKPVKIDSSSSEIWGLFKKGDFEYDFNSVYNEQLKVIKNFKIKYFLHSIKNTPRRLIKVLLPNKIVNYIKNIKKT